MLFDTVSCRSLVYFHR